MLNYDFCYLFIKYESCVQQVMTFYPNYWNTSSINETEPESLTPYRLAMHFLDLNVWIFKAHYIFDLHATEHQSKAPLLLPLVYTISHRRHKINVL